MQHTAQIGMFAGSTPVADPVDEKRPVSPVYRTRAYRDIEAEAKQLLEQHQHWTRSQRALYERSPLMELQGAPGQGAAPYSTSAQYERAYERALDRAARWLQSHGHDHDQPVSEVGAGGDFWKGVRLGGIALANVWRLQAEEEQRAKEEAEQEAQRREAERAQLRRQVKLDPSWLEQQRKAVEDAAQAEERLAQLERDLRLHRRAQVARQQLEDAAIQARTAAQRLRAEWREPVEDPRLPDVQPAPVEAVEFEQLHRFGLPEPRRQ